MSQLGDAITKALLARQMMDQQKVDEKKKQDDEDEDKLDLYAKAKTVLGYGERKPQ